jgi:hypothetical protein
MTNALDYLVPVPPQRDLPVNALVGCFTQSQCKALMLPAHWNLGVSITWSIILVCIVVTLLYCCHLPLAHCILKSAAQPSQRERREDRVGTSLIAQTGNPPPPIVIPPQQQQPIWTYRRLHPYPDLDHDSLSKLPSYKTARSRHGSRTSLTAQLFDQACEGVASRANYVEKKRHHRSSAWIAEEGDTGHTSTAAYHQKGGGVKFC